MYQLHLQNTLDVSRQLRIIQISPIHNAGLARTFERSLQHISNNLQGSAPVRTIACFDLTQYAGYVQAVRQLEHTLPENLVRQLNQLMQVPSASRNTSIRPHSRGDEKPLYNNRRSRRLR